MPNTHNNAVEQLRLQFIAGLPQFAHQIEALWHRLRYVNWSTQGVQTLHKIVHRLVGSGSSFGLPDISGSACMLDTYLQEHLDLQQPLGGIEREIIEQMVNHLVLTILHAEPENTINPPVSNTHISADKRIYLVDDDLPLTALMTIYLRASGFLVQQFDTATECMKQVYAEKPHAILMDVGLHGEGLQGLEAVEQMRQELGNLIPIILLSARTDIHARLRALRAGCAEYLSKPINFSHLVNTLELIINTHKVTRRVIVVDDEELMAEYHAEILRHAGMEVICLTNPLQGLQLAIEFKPDLMVLDMHMPNINGIELATLLRQEEQFCVLPIVFITADTSDTLRHLLEGLGVNGILTKPINIENFLSVCECAINDTVALKNRIARVTQRGTHHQQITRSYFFSAIENELQQQPYRMMPSALYYIGLDGLEALHEKYGRTGVINLHEQYCQFIAKIIGTDEQWADTSNLVVCVLAGQRTNEHHHQRIEQIITHLNTLNYVLANETFTLKASAGLSYLQCELGSANRALLHAEESYEKTRAHNNHEEQHVNINTKSAQKIPATILNIDFTQGLPTNNLALFYQPMLSLEDPNIENHEVLVRWQTETGELIPAAKFLHYIDRSSMRIELDRWVLQAATTAISTDSNLRESANLFIHLSEETLEQKSFFSFAANVLRDSRLRGDKRLIFMLEEPWITMHPEQTADIIKALMDIHCGICLAHAGATTATEKLIRSAHFDYIKLTPRLTENLIVNSEQAAQLQLIASTAKNLGIHIIATQVEDSKNLSSLWMMGVRLFQGFFIQPPEKQLNPRVEMN